ncbi:YncE family protein, partial [Candidatus Neomarinimicrobiota bacterium]
DGVLLIDLDSLAVVDSLLLSEVPRCLTISPDSSMLYALTRNYIYRLSTCNFTLIDSVEVPGGYPEVLAISPDGHYLFGGGYEIFFVIDTRTQTTIVSTDTLNIQAMVTDPTEPVVYGSRHHVDLTCSGREIFRFDTRTMSFNRIYARENVFECHDIHPTDIQVTSDGIHLLFPSYERDCSLESTGLGRGNVLHHLDLVSGELLAETCLDASYAYLAVTADNQYAYITDAGHRISLEIFPSGILRRYHLLTLSVDDFIDFSQFDLTLSDGSPPLEYIALLPDKSTAVISSEVRGADIMIVDLTAQTLVSKIDLGKKRIMAICLGPGL